MISQIITYSLISLTFYFSITGYGLLGISIINTKEKFSYYNSCIFILGLNLIAFFAIIINFFFPISDLISIITIFAGLIIYGLIKLNSLNFNFEKKKILFIFFVLITSVFFSYFTRLNDDYNYHYLTIFNYKTLALEDINHQLRTSYNSIWLIIHSMFYLSFYNESLFIIVSLLYSLVVGDSFFCLKKNLKENNFLPMILSFFLVIFLLGVINSHKEYGTDFPGQIIYGIVFIVFFENYLKFEEKNKNIFFIILILGVFSTLIKISNFWILILILAIFLNSKEKYIKIFKGSFYCSTLFLWIFQNYKISGCLVWPLHFTCFDNRQQAYDELEHIERFAKGDMNLTYKLNYIENFNWLENWFNFHFIKIIETYGLFFLILLMPLIFTIFYSFLKNISSKFYISFKNFLNLNRTHYLIFIFITILHFSIWFLKTPAHRFAIISNLNMLIIFLLPIWYFMFQNNIRIFKKYLIIILVIAIAFFTENNINKYQKYYDRHGNKWPPKLSKDV